MTDIETPLRQMMIASAQNMGITLPDASQDAIMRDMATILEQARICEDSLAEETALTEIAPVFRP